MTPEEILRDLRDIHLPERAADLAGGAFVFWPAALDVAVAILAGWLAWRRRTAWRRDIVQHLDAIEHSVDEGRVKQGWTDLATLLRRIAIRLSDKGDIAGLIGDAWLHRLDHLFETDVFTQGPGRGITTFPYSANGMHDENDSVADQLRATIRDVREHLPKLKIAT